jgi:hypothetical protein
VFLLSPKSCSNPWSESGDRELDLEELTSGSVHPELPRFHRSRVLLTGLTGVSTLWDLSRVNCLICLSLGCAVVGQFLVSSELFC